MKKARHILNLKAHSKTISLLTAILNHKFSGLLFETFMHHLKENINFLLKAAET